MKNIRPGFGRWIVLEAGLLVYGMLSTYIIMSPISTPVEGIISLPIIPVLISTDIIRTVVAPPVLIPEPVLLLIVGTVEFVILLTVSRVLSRFQSRSPLWSWFISVGSFLAISGIWLFASTYIPASMVTMATQTCQQAGSDCFIELTTGYFSHPVNELRVTAMAISFGGVGLLLGDEFLKDHSLVRS